MAVTTNCSVEGCPADFQDADGAWQGYYCESDGTCSGPAGGYSSEGVGLEGVGDDIASQDDIASAGDRGTEEGEDVLSDTYGEAVEGDELFLEDALVTLSRDDDSTVSWTGTIETIIASMTMADDSSDDTADVEDDFTSADISSETYTGFEYATAEEERLIARFGSAHTLDEIIDNAISAMANDIINSALVVEYAFRQIREPKFTTDELSSFKVSEKKEGISISTTMSAGDLTTTTTPESY